VSVTPFLTLGRCGFDEGSTGYVYSVLQFLLEATGGLVTLLHMIRIKRTIILSILFVMLASCEFNPLDIDLAPGWKAQSLAAMRHTRPDMLAISPNGTWLYSSCELKQDLLAPSLIAINMKNGHQHTLIYGLHRADGLKFAPDGSLWLGEEFDKGLIWRIAEPDKLPEEQRVDRDALRSSHAAIAPLMAAGRFSHEGFTFSNDGRYAYLADEWKEGCVFRMDMKTRKLSVFHRDKGWLSIRNPDQARVEAEILHASYFNRLEDMETLPDGSILMAETETGKILQLDDSGKKPVIRTWLTRPEMKHPDNLAWDASRDWLWITDDDKPSFLWAWDGHSLLQVMRHDHAEITGVITHGDDVYVNIQMTGGGTEVTLKLTEKPQKMRE
jgi:sugar lactone lactonase YvrE